jgi:hypothetical protein
MAALGGGEPDRDSGETSLRRWKKPKKIFLKKKLLLGERRELLAVV